MLKHEFFLKRFKLENEALDGVGFWMQLFASAKRFLKFHFMVLHEVSDYHSWGSRYSIVAVG